MNLFKQISRVVEVLGGTNLAVGLLVASISFESYLSHNASHPALNVNLGIQHQEAFKPAVRKNLDSDTKPNDEKKNQTPDAPEKNESPSSPNS